MVFEYDADATPLTAEEAEALIPKYIATRADLNMAEQSNILDGEQWALRRRRDVLSEPFLRRLHREMFGQVWKWAGEYRKSPRNLGVDAWRITPELATMLDDVRFWVQEEIYPADEIAMRFHHRLVWIHPFPNGNGRHGRLAADLLVMQQGRPRFSWGRTTLTAPNETRQGYIAALRAADDHDIAPLLAFARS